MFKSLKASNGSFAAVGNLQVQPAVNDLGKNVKQQATSPASLKSNVAPAHQAIIDTSTVVHSSDGLKTNKGSLQSIASALMSDKSFLLPPYHSKVNSILPGFAKNLEPTSQPNKPSATKAASFKRFEPYEQLTGISQERPEVVILTNFLPLFVSDVGHSQPSFIHLVENGGIYPFMTDAGRFVDTHLQARNLRHVDAIHLVRNIRSRYPTVSDQITSRKQAFEASVDSLKDSANFLLGLVRSLERQKEHLDLRDDIHIVDPDDVINQYSLNFSRLNTAGSPDSLHYYARRYMPSTYSVVDMMVRLGYNFSNVKGKFSSTKIWLQLLYEIKNVLSHHSNEFLDVDPTSQRLDSNAAVLSKHTAAKFGIRQALPALKSLNELSTLQPAQVHAAISNVNQAWRVLYQNVHFKSAEAHIAALVNLVSKEFRYSYGLSTPDVQQSLSNHYDYNVTSNNNENVFEYVFGRFGNNITDFPSEQRQSLVGLAQQQPAEDVGVLTFESKYVDGDSGTLTPGAAFFVDQALKTDGKEFDTQRLDELSLLFEKKHKSLGVVLHGMNALAVKVGDQVERVSAQFSSLLSSPVDLTNEILKNLVDEQTGATLPSAVNDNLGAVYSYAVSNPDVKAALFLYTIAKVTRSYHATIPFFDPSFDLSKDNTPLTDFLIANVVSALGMKIPEAQSGVQAVAAALGQNKLPVLTKDTIQASLKSGTPLTKFIESTMKQVLMAFKEDDKAMLNQRTRFNGYPDTVVMMVMFDAIIQMVQRYNNQSLTSSNLGPTAYAFGTLTFNVSRTKNNNKASVNELTTRLEKEVALTQKLLYVVLNTLKKLSNSLRNQSNYLKSPAAVNKLREISEVIGDSRLLSMLMSEQQIMLLSSTVHDLVDRISQRDVASSNGDVDGDGDFDADDELKVLDDSVVLPKLRNAIYGLMSSKEYASSKGYNKKILTVGIPLGFTHKLKQRISVNKLKKTSFADKQSDIVSVVVYKVDLQNSDIIYRPQRFLFELSRFPVRNDKHFLPLTEKPTLDEIAHSIPTRDFGQGFERGSSLEYWALDASRVNRSQKLAFSDESYSFLTEHEKAQLIKNHVLSYLLETYVRLLTGISVADYHFDLVDQPRPMGDDMVKLITEHCVANVVDQLSSNQVTSQASKAPSGGVLFATTMAKKPGYVAGKAAQAVSQPLLSNPAGVPGNVSTAAQLYGIQGKPSVKTLEAQLDIGQLSTNLAGVSARNVPAVLHNLRNISGLSHMLTPLVDPLLVSKRIVSPKQFDRVFNVIVDPDEFEIDYEKTVKTPDGKQALEQMIKTGDVIVEDENYKAKRLLGRPTFVGFGKDPTGRSFPQGRAAPNVSLYRFRDRDKNQGDIAFEKYFVTIETYGDDEV